MASPNPVPTTLIPPFRVGLIAFSDGRTRVHKSLEPTIRQYLETLTSAIRSDARLEVVEASEIVHSGAGAARMARELRARQVEALVFAVPVFAFPNFSVISARVLGLPVLLCSPQNPGLPGLGGILAAHGALVQIGLPSRKLWGDPTKDAALMARLSGYCRAVGTIERMKGTIYGLIGGRSIGMNTGVPDTIQWMQKFGVDVEHIDQLEIIRRAELAAEEEVERGYAWLTAHVGQAKLKGKSSPENIRQQIRHHIAMRDLVAEFGLDFLGLKCHYELSEYHVTGCLSAMLLNDPYDWNGPKQTTVMACEADSDGALTMQILKLISGYPTMLQDLRAFDGENQVYACCNCGAQPSWFAKRSADPKENLRHVNLEPVIEKYAGGGAHYAYNCAPGPITLARLSRPKGHYRMFVGRGEYVDFPPEKRQQTCGAWPHGFVRMGIKPAELIDTFNANHIHVAAGDHVEAIKTYCELMDIPVDVVE
jgi:L-fucose/D-arabinose isomerase